MDDERTRKLEAAKKKLKKFQTKTRKVAGLSDDGASEGRTDTTSINGDEQVSSEAVSKPVPEPPTVQPNSPVPDFTLDRDDVITDAERNLYVTSPTISPQRATATGTDDAEHNYRKQIHQLEEVLRKAQTTNETLSSQIASLEARNEQLESQVEELGASASGVAEQDARRSADAQETIRQLREKLNTLSLTSDSGRRAVMDENQLLREKVSQLEAEATAKVQHLLSEREEAIERLQGELRVTKDAAKTAKTDAATQQQQLIAKISELERRLQDQQNTKSQDDEITQLRTERQGLENKVHALVKETEALRASLLRSDMDKEGLENRYEGLLHDLNISKSSKATLDEEIERLNVKCQALDAENQLLEEARDVAVAELAAKMKEIVKENNVLIKERAQLIEDVEVARRSSLDVSGRNSVDQQGSPVIMSPRQIAATTISAAQQDLFDENKVLRMELDRLRLAQAEIGSVLLNNPDPAASDLVRVLQRRCDELAGDVQTYRQTAEDAREMAEQAKLAFHDRDVERDKVVELEKELEMCTSRLERERANWKAKEQTLHAELSRVGKGRERSRSNDEVIELRRYIMALGGQADTNLTAWAKWAVAEQERLREEIKEAHMTIDLQHEKLLAGTPASTPASTPATGQLPDTFTTRTSGTSIDQETQTDPMLAFARLSTIKANLVEGPKRRNYGGVRSPSSRSARSSIAGGSRRGSITSVAHSVVSSPAGPGFPSVLSPTALIPPDAQTASSIFALDLELSQLRGQLAKLTSRYAELQQAKDSTQQHLDHQMRVNQEMKKLIVGASVGVSAAPASSSLWGGGASAGAGHVEGNILERYADAMSQIGVLQEEVDKWRRRCEEVEEVVEAVVLQQAQDEEEAAAEGYDDVTDGEISERGRPSIGFGRGREGVAVLEDTTSLFSGSSASAAFPVGFGGQNLDGHASHQHGHEHHHHEGSQLYDHGHDHAHNHHYDHTQQHSHNHTSLIRTIMAPTLITMNSMLMAHHYMHTLTRTMSITITREITTAITTPVATIMTMIIRTITKRTTTTTMIITITTTITMTMTITTTTTTPTARNPSPYRPSNTPKAFTLLCIRIRFLRGHRRMGVLGVATLVGCVPSVEIDH
ncbi:hypothetical protein HDV00_011794 [Rhizophlyctis rosea]|nr:hypothetical protein HDV00_011794 [Rhizophlyctis rosea]